MIRTLKHHDAVRIGSDGTVKSTGAFNATDSDENTDWVKWNRARDGR